MTNLKRLADADLRLLRIYKTVVETGGFAAAEVSLNISRAAISKAISDLETRLGTRLCSRGRAGFAVTDEGEQVYQAILRLLSAIESFRTEVNSLHEQLQGEFNIGITDNLVSMPHMHITNSLGELKQHGPRIQINISMIPSIRVEQGILDGQLHAGAIANHHQLPELSYLPLYQEESLLYASNQHPCFGLSGAKLNQAITHADAVAPSYVQSPSIRGHYQSLNTTATATDREGVAFLILTGQYIGFLPCHYAQQWVVARKMRSIGEQQYRFLTEFSIVTRKNRRPNMILDFWLDSLSKQR